MSHWRVLRACMAVDAEYEELLRQQKEANANGGVHEEEEEKMEENGEGGATAATTGATAGEVTSPSGGRGRAKR